MRTKPNIITPLTVFLLGSSTMISASVMAQTETLPPPEIQAAPLPSPEPPPILPAQQETIRQLIEKEIQQTREIPDQVNEQINDAFGTTMGLLNLLITVLIAIPIGTGFVLWWLRQSVIDRLVNDIQKQFQEETEQLVKQHLTQTVTIQVQQQLEEFKSQLNTLYRDAKNYKGKVVQEMDQLIDSVGSNETVPPPVGQRLRELTEQLEAIKTESGISLSAYDYLTEADAFYLSRRYTEAITSYKAALAIDPDLIEAWLGLAKTLRRIGRYPEAMAANEEVIHRQPHNPWGWFGKGYVLSDLQQYEAAVAAYDTAIEADSRRSTFWKHRGYALTQCQRYAEALDCFDKAIRLKPESAGAYYWKATCYAAQHQAELAVEQLQEAFRYRPDYRNRVQLDPDFDSIRQTPSFQKLIAD
jgi:tetratricopeptide (TPR) repeat protein